MATKLTKIELLSELAKRGVRLRIGGCGCCGSPWAIFVLDGNVVFDQDGHADMDSLIESNLRPQEKSSDN